MRGLRTRRVDVTQCHFLTIFNAPLNHGLHVRISWMTPKTMAFGFWTNSHLTFRRVSGTGTTDERGQCSFRLFSFHFEHLTNSPHPACLNGNRMRSIPE